MENDDPRLSRRLVRMYSDELENRLPSNSNARILGNRLTEDKCIERADLNPWRLFLKPSTAADTDE